MSLRAGTSLPIGTVTFLFTDIEGSTNLVRTLGAERFAAVLEQHGRVLRTAFDAHGGVGVRTEGDSFFYAFAVPAQALAGATDAQRALVAQVWPFGATVKVRMGMHTGEGRLGGRESGVDYIGYDVHRAARVAASGHGGQILVSEVTQALVHDRLPEGVTLVDLGEHRFKDLGRPERVYQATLAGLPSAFPRIKSLDAIPNNLPTQLTSFIGREGDIAEGVRMLGGTRLLTLTGPGGTGKTRLSIQIAAAAADEFPGGVVFVPLAPLVDPALVPSTIAHELGLPADGKLAPLDQVAEHLKDRRVLLVLDNLEQLLAAGPLLADLLKRAPGVKMLGSSRAALRVYGEQELPVAPLGLPDALATGDLERLTQYESVRLFIERARAARPDFSVTNDNAPAVAGICVRVDGLPLAIELAAARLRLLTPQAIYAKLDRSLNLLATGHRDLPARQQTLRGAIAWSYDLLEEPVRRLFRVISCFAGGAGLELIEALCTGTCADLEPLAGVEQLVLHSLLRQRDEHGEPRFHMLQTIREYGLERLGESADAAEVRRQHAALYLTLAEQGAGHLLGGERKRWLDRLELEVDNFRQAMEWSIRTGATDTARRLVTALWRLWQMRGYLSEGQALIERVLALPTDESPDGTARLAATLEAAGGVAYWLGRMDRCRDSYQRALDLCRHLGDPKAIANACYNLSFPAVMDEKGRGPGAARELIDEALRIYRDLGDEGGQAKALWALSQNILLVEGDKAGSWRTLEEAIALFRAAGDRFGLGWALHGAGTTLTVDRRFAEARAALGEAIRSFADDGDVSAISLILDDFARLEEAEGRPARALVLQGASISLQRRIGATLAARVADFIAPAPAPRQHLDAATADAAWAEGLAMDLPAAVAYALAPPEAESPSTQTEAP
jgi:predicted ATPase/class 3 adenylate cyclase